MTEPDFTPRNVAKFAVKTAIHLKAKRLAQNALTDYTPLDSDNITVKVSSSVIGWGVASKAKPYTDKVVDKIADKVTSIKENRQAKKDTTE
jgi:hypothetical protein